MKCFKSIISRLVPFFSMIFILISSENPVGATEMRQPSIAQRVSAKLKGLLWPQITFLAQPPNTFFLNPLPSFRSLKDGARVKVVGQSDPFIANVFTLENGAFHYSDKLGQSEVYINDRFENILLDYSWNNQGGESGVVTSFDGNAIPLAYSEMISVRASQISSPIMHRLVNQVTAASRPFLIDLVHTHPGYEYISYYGNEKRDLNYKVSALSSDDFVETFLISQRMINIYVRIRAVLPNGYNYSMTFLNGNRVKDPLYEKSRLGKETKEFYFKTRFPEIKIDSDLRAKILKASMLSELEKYAKESNQKALADNLLASVGVPKTEENYELWRLNAESLLAEGEPHDTAVKALKDHYIYIRNDRVLSAAGISIADHHRDLYLLTVDSLAAQGFSESHIVEQIQRVIQQLKADRDIYKLEVGHNLKPTSRTCSEFYL